ncbi:MAG: extensin family protein [Hyphomicrobiales bacterium]|nr:extensin family protein [Hyphomicrobiales bacterium]
MRALIPALIALPVAAQPVPPPRPAEFAPLPALALTPPPDEPPRAMSRQFTPPPAYMPSAPQDAPLAYAPAPPPAAPPLGPGGDACLALAASGLALAETLAPVAGEGGCGVLDPVLLKGVVMADKRIAPLEPPATVRCELALEFARFVSGDIAATLEKDGAKIKRLISAGSYDCRGRNRQAGAKLSEHGKGDAIDMIAVQMSDGRTVVWPKTGDVALGNALRTAACAHFSTVLGPGSDGFHEEHIHLDLEQRGHGAKICQWSVQ